MGGSTTPVIWAGVGESCEAIDFGRDQHGFVARKDGLAEGDGATSFVDNTNVGVCAFAVRLVREGLLDVSTVVAVETAVLVVSDMFTSAVDLLTIDFG